MKLITKLYKLLVSIYDRFYLTEEIMPQLSEVTAPKPETENKERKQVIRFGHLNEPERLIRLNIFNASRAKIGASRTTLAGTDNGLTTWQDLREAGPSQAPVGTTENLLSFNGSRLGEQFLTQVRWHILCLLPIKTLIELPLLACAI